MAKNTTYSRLGNILLVISFNQPRTSTLNPETGEHSQEIQPIVVEARTEAITDEGAVRNVTKTLNVGAVVQTPLTNQEIYTKVKAFNTPLANLLKDAVIEALDIDPSV